MCIRDRRLLDQSCIMVEKGLEELLRLLVENQGTTLSRSRLIDRIWTDGAESVSYTHLHWIRCCRK